MKRLFIVFLISVVIAPVIFAVYYPLDLVCKPRAILSSALFGILPLIFLSITLFREKESLFYIPLSLLLIEIIIIPIIMLQQLGWEKFANDRLLAFFTFEGFAVTQLFITIVLLTKFIKEKTVPPSGCSMQG